MTCPKCGSNHVVSEQKAVTNIKVKVKNSHNILWWILLGWAFILYKAIALIFKAVYFILIGWWVKLIKKNKQRREAKTIVHICQECGYRWETVGMDRRYLEPVDAEAV